MFKFLFCVLAAASLLNLTGCSGKSESAPPSSQEINAFAPGMKSLPPDAKAAQEKNEQLMRQKQQQAAQAPAAQAPAAQAPAAQAPAAQAPAAQ